jgi:branched-chain amino acid aminotransferase
MSIGVVQAVVWVNGNRQRDETAHVSARDRGFTLGDGVFETMRVRGRAVFRLDRHLARLQRGLQVLQIPAPGELREWVLRAAAESGLPDASIRLTVTRGRGPAGVAPPDHPQPTVTVIAAPMPLFPASTYTAGLSAHVASGRRNEFSATAGLKTLSYVDAVAALLEARRAGMDEALLLDTQGHCSEATASNLFAWTGAELVTPRVSCGALPGITREAVLELANAAGLPAVERVLTLDELISSAEAFLTSSLRGVAPLVRVGAHAIGDGVPGRMTKGLTEAYLALVERERSLVP